MKTRLLLFICITQLSHASPSTPSGKDPIHSKETNRDKQLAIEVHADVIVEVLKHKKLIPDKLPGTSFSSPYYYIGDFPSKNAPLGSLVLKNGVTFFATQPQNSSPSYVPLIINGRPCLVQDTNTPSFILSEYPIKDILCFMKTVFSDSPASRYILDTLKIELDKQKESLYDAFQRQNYPKVHTILFSLYEKKGDDESIKDCISELTPYAEQGDVYAMFELSRHFIEAYLTSKKPGHLTSAIHWFTRASIREDQDLCCHKSSQDAPISRLSFLYFVFLTKKIDTSSFLSLLNAHFEDNLTWVITLFKSTRNIPSPVWICYRNFESILNLENTPYLQTKETWYMLRGDRLSHSDLIKSDLIKTISNDLPR